MSTTAHNAPRAGGAHNAKVMNRFELTKRLVAKLKRDEAVIGGIGNTNFDLWASGQRPQNFYMLGSMGLTIPIALGVAIAQPKRHVIALEGDGSLLMQLGCLGTVAARAPKNLTIVVWDNGIYQITGGQPTASAATVDLVAPDAAIENLVKMMTYVDKRAAGIDRSKLTDYSIVRELIQSNTIPVKR